MSNRFDDDDFKFDDDDFGDENTFDIDTGFDNDLEEDDLPPLDDEEDVSASRGPSRTFLVIAGVIILLFVVALVALVLIVSNQGPAPVALTATAESGTIIAANATTFANATETAVALEQFNLQQTQAAFNLTQTALVPTATLAYTHAHRDAHTHRGPSSVGRNCPADAGRAGSDGDGPGADRRGLADAGRRPCRRRGADRNRPGQSAAAAYTRNQRAYAGNRGDSGAYSPA